VKVKLSSLAKFLVVLAIGLSTHAAIAQTFTINGVDSSSIEENILLFVKDVSPPVSEFDVDDYSLKLVDATKKAVRAFAYYNAEVDVMPITYASSEQLKVTLDLTLHKKTLVSRVILPPAFMTIASSKSPTPEPSEFSNMPPKLKALFGELLAMQGKPLDHAKYESIKGQLRTFALIYGYFDFRFLVHKLLIIPSQEEAKSDATIHWLFSLGQRYQFGDVVFLQETRGQGIALDVKPFEQGDFFDQSKVGEYSIDMASTGYFENAIARPNADKAENYKVPIEVILQPKPKDLYKFGIGFSTDTKARVSVDWERPWVNLDGHSLGSSLYLSNPRQSISLDYRIPKANPLNDFLNYRVAYKRTNENDTVSDTTSFEILRQWGAEKEDNWNKIGFLKVENESFVQGLQEEETTLLVMPGLTFSRTRKQGDIFIDWGDRQQLTIQGASESLLSDIDFFKVLARTKWIREYGKHRLTARADVGAISTNDFSRVPSSQRFFAGGDQSIRGFGFNEYSSFETVIIDGEAETRLIGGQYLGVASIEYAYKVAANWRAAAFYDVGSADDSFGANLARGFGVGAHWLSPIGNVQVYVARGLADLDDTVRLHIIIGPGL
jgi:translocation and assembly module TamA